MPEEPRRCFHCRSPETEKVKVIRFYHNGQSDFFHDVCVGVWLMLHPDQSICFEPGETR